MKRYFIALLLCVVFCGCHSIKNVSREKPFSQMINKKFELVVDCFVLAPVNFEFPELLPAGYFSQMPKEVKHEYIGQYIDILDQKIIGVVPKGTVFQIKEALARFSFNSWTVDYKIKIIGNQQHDFLLACWLIDPLFSWTSHNPPQILRKYAIAVNDK
jgi:hypothetical protein